MVRKRFFGAILAVLFIGILTGCSEAAAPSAEDVQTEDARQSGQAEPEESEIIDDSPQDQQSAEGEETRSQVILISPDREKIEWAIYSEGTYCYGNGSLCGYLSEDGEEITPCIYSDAMPFSEGLACVCLDGKYGYIGKDGEVALPFIYDQAASFREGVAYFSCGEEYGLIDREGNVVLELTDCDSISSFREGLACFSVDGQYGYMDKNGRIVVEPVYDDAGYFYAGLAVVMKDGFGGVIGKDGREILPPEYIGISTEDTCIIAQKEDGFSFFDNEGNEVSSGAWDWVSAGSDVFYITQNDRKGFADKNGKVILEPTYEYIRPIPEKELVIVQNENKKYGILDYEGEVRIPFIYDDLRGFTEDRAVAQLGGKCGVVRYDGTVEVPIEYDRISLFSDGSMAVWTDETAELTDRQGNRILIGKYNSIMELGDGYKTWTSGKGSEYRDRQGKLIACTDDYVWQNFVYGAENSYILYTGSLLREGEENGKSSEEFLLTNQITPRAGLFMEFTKNGSLGDRGDEELVIRDIENMPQGRRFSKLYRMGEWNSTVLYYYAEPWRRSGFPESGSGLFAVRDGQLELLIEASECGGSMRGDWICFWYDTEGKVCKPGTSGVWGGLPGYAYSGSVYGVKNGQAVVETSFEYYEYEDEYSINNKEVSEKEYNAVRERYRYYMPLDIEY